MHNPCAPSATSSSSPTFKSTKNDVGHVLIVKQQTGDFYGERDTHIEHFDRFAQKKLATKRIAAPQIQFHIVCVGIDHEHRLVVQINRRATKRDSTVANDGVINKCFPIIGIRHNGVLPVKEQHIPAVLIDNMRIRVIGDRIFMC